MTGLTVFDGGIKAVPCKQGAQDLAAESLFHANLLSAFLDSTTSGIRAQRNRNAGEGSARLGNSEYCDQATQIATAQTTRLSNAFRTMMASATVADLQTSASYQHFAHRYDSTVRIAQDPQRQDVKLRPQDTVSPEANLKSALASGIPSKEIMQQIQDRLQKAGQLLKSGDLEAGKAAYNQAIELADKNYDAQMNVDTIRQLQTVLKTGSFNGKELTQQDRMQVSNELFQRFAAATLPYQLRSGSILKDHSGYATVLRQADQNRAAEIAYKDAIGKADALPIAEMKQQAQLIADEIGKTNNKDYQNFLSDFSKILVGSKDSNGNDVPGTIKLPIAARKDLIDFYVRPQLQEDGTAIMVTNTKDGIPRYIPDHSVVFKPEEAAKVADETVIKYKELYNVDLDRDPAKDMELAVYRSTIDNNLPENLRKRRDEKSYGFDSTVSNMTAMGVGLLGTFLLSRTPVGRAAAKVLPGLFEEGAAAGQLNGMGKATEFIASGALASVTRNQMMTNVFDRKDETIGMSIANGFASTFGARAFFAAPKFLADQVFLRGFTAEAATARAAKMVGPDGFAQLAKLRELRPELVVPKEITTFEQWANSASTSDRATAIGVMSGKLEKTGFLTRMSNLPNTVIGQPLRSAENLSAGGITTRRMFAGGLAAGGVNAMTDAADSYSRLWPKMMSGEMTDDNGNIVEPTFANMVIKPIYKSPTDNSFLSGMLLGSYIAKPGSLLAKPWSLSQINPLRQNTLGGKIIGTLGLPITIGQMVTDSLPKYVGSLGDSTVSSVGGSIANSLQMQIWNLQRESEEHKVADYIDEELRRNDEKLSDRKIQKPKAQ